ncbi:MAG: histidine phosphatase family protein [bacterium]|nr:histidine phosphatase family protein [bacterium]
MITTVYLMRHSITEKVNYLDDNDNLLVKNQKQILTIEGEELARKVSGNKIFSNIDIVIASNYARAMATAKYFTNGKSINIIKDFGERLFGVDDYSDIPDDFYKRQLEEDDYKIGKGESQREVRERMSMALSRVINDNRGKSILIVSHGTAIIFLLKKWCSVKENKYLLYKNKVILENNCKNCETIRLVFNNKELIEIDNMKELLI